MAKKKSVTLRDLEHEAKKFRTPATDKEKSIIEAAVALMGERGIGGATTAEIARRAGVTEKTLFRYFPSKKDLINRVLFPVLLQSGLTRLWEQVEAVLKTKSPNLKSWYVDAITRELSGVAKNVGLTRTVSIELLQNEELRGALASLWQQRIWRPMVDGLEELKATGMIRKEVDVEVLARAIHCLHVGYFLTRHVFGSDQEWDDAWEIDQMAEILTGGSTGAARRA
jgi:AcrR family transcriptional regulator